MNPLLRAPYAAAWGAARSLARHVPTGDSKLHRVLAGRAGLIERFEKWGATGRDRARRLVWLHAPSVGEGLQALPVLQLLRARRPEVQIAYTFYSPSAEQFAASLAADFADYLPFDTSGDATRAIQALAPSALIYSKLDVWPVLAERASRAGVSLGIISATLPRDSHRTGWLGRALLADAYRALDAVGAITLEDARRFQSLGVPQERISVTGDTRYDQVWARAHRSASLPLIHSLRSERPTLVAGSTWPSDESRLLAAWGRVRAVMPRARLIIAPHEISEVHLTGLFGWCRARSWSAARLDSAFPGTDVIIVDRTGILGDLYALADIAYVGGGFHRAGLHSVLEPAAFGAPVLFGPNNRKSHDPAALIRAGAGFEVADTTSMETELLRLLGSDADCDAAGQSAQEVIQSGLGAAERSYALVCRLLDAG